jgi:AcrR family transcriptional regulator
MVSTALAISLLLIAERLENVYAVNMTNKANSVNIAKIPRRYHHGDLRSAALEQGLRLLEAGSAENISLREIARNVGVSATAIYRHFPDKESLLAALASVGFDQLAAEQRKVFGLGSASGFAASGRAYVQFAIANPALFRLMFSSMPFNVKHGQSAPKDSAAGLLHAGVARMMGEAADQKAVFTGMLRAWSLVHGLSMLILDQQVDRLVAEDLLEDIISSTIVTHT